MPASHLIAGMARSYGCPAKSFSDTCLAKSFSEGCPAIRFTDKWLTQKVSCIEGTKSIITEVKNSPRYLFHLASNNAKNCCSSSTAAPNSRALSNLLPASTPATT
jgi:hypothetical protein